MKIWTDLDHRLSVVKRWGTVQTLHQQSVAEHIFNVERIAVRIAQEWFGVTSTESLFAVMHFAHRHEDFESLSGDFPTMVKPYFDEIAFEQEHSDLITPVIDGGQWVRNIVKLADMLDAWAFLCVENRLGNRYIEHHYEHEPIRIMSFVQKTWPDDTILWKQISSGIDDIERAASHRHSKRGR